MAYQLDNISKRAPAKKVVSEKESFLKKEIALFNDTFSNKIKRRFFY
jgi:hypothetical protein